MSKNTSSPPDKPKLILAVDLGGSLTKVFYYDKPAPQGIEFITASEDADFFGNAHCSV